MIDCFGSLRIVRPGRNARCTMTFKAPDIVFTGDEEKRIAGEVARAIAEEIRACLSSGRAPDGSPLPASTAATLERRGFRVAQAQRGGAAHPRYTDPAYRNRVQKQFNKRFTAAKLGSFQPQPSAKSFGYESGMTAQSVVCVPNNEGGWDVFFAANRAKLDRSGSSAVLRIFKRIPFVTPAIVQSPRVQQALENVAKNLWAPKAKAALMALVAAGQEVKALSEELGEGGEG